MKDNILKIRTLIDRFFDGETTLDEEQQLYDFFQQTPTLPPDLVPLRDMFLDLHAVQYVATESQQTTQGPTGLQDGRSPRRLPIWAVAAAITVLLLGGAALLFQRHAQPNVIQPEEELVAYVYGQRVTDHDQVIKEMHRTMTAMAAPDGSDDVGDQLKAMFKN